MSDEPRDYRVVDLPGYMVWSRRMLAQGESEAVMAHLDAMSSWLTPIELASITDEFFDELLAEVKFEVEKPGSRPS